MFIEVLVELFDHKYETAPEAVSVIVPEEHEVNAPVC